MALNPYEDLIRAAMDRGDDAGPLLLALFGLVHARFGQSERVNADRAQIAADLTAYGQAGIDGTLAPIYAAIRGKADLGAVLTAQSSSILTIGTGLKSLVVGPEGARAAFAPAHILSLVSADDAALGMFGRRLSYDPGTGELTVDVLVASGSGTTAGWIVAPSSLAPIAGEVLISPVTGIAGPSLQAALGQIAGLLAGKIGATDVSEIGAALLAAADAAAGRSAIGAVAAGHGHAIADVTDLGAALAARELSAAKGQPDGYAGLGSDGKVPAAQLPDAAYRNVLINPTGAVVQRVPGSVGDDAYAWDRWYALSQFTAGTDNTWSQLADVADGLPSMMRLTQSHGSPGRLGAAQIVEAADGKRLRGRKVVLSGKIRSSAAANIRYAILEWIGTADVVTSDVVADWTSTSYAVGGFFAGSNLVVRQAGVLTVIAGALTDLAAPAAQLGSSLNNIVVMIWTSAPLADGGTLDFALQLEEGSVPTALERRPRGLEETLCRRYYQRKVLRSVAGSRHVPLARMRAAPVIAVDVGSAASITADGFELTHSAAADCTVTADAEL